MLAEVTYSPYVSILQQTTDSHYQLSREDQVLMLLLKDWAVKTQTPYVHKILHWTIFCVQVWYITYGGGTLPEVLSDPLESESKQIGVYKGGWMSTALMHT